AAHKINFVINIVDQNGNLVSNGNLATSSSFAMNFADSFGAYSNPSNTWGQYNYSIALPQVTLTANQRLQLQMTFVSQLNNGQLPMKLEIDNSAITGQSNSMLQVPHPDTPFPAYYTYQHGQDGNVYVYNPGPNAAWLTDNTRVTFETIDASQAYGSVNCGFGGNPHEQLTDSSIFTVGSTLSVCFSPPALTPSQNANGDITPGRYRMYAFLSGYDQKGEPFFVTQYIGVVRVT
ncbi:MAG: hypothetical protein KGI08_10760, partial [Thaumarchaeota archaeon]|nr:hypothetical protein [Nitrososphaerota archaeon]